MITLKGMTLTLFHLINMQSIRKGMSEVQILLL